MDYIYDTASHSLGVALHSESGGLCREPFFWPSQTIVCIEGTDLFWNSFGRLLQMFKGSIEKFMEICQSV